MSWKVCLLLLFFFFFLVRRDVKQLAFGASGVGCRFSGIDCTHDLLMPAHFFLGFGELFFMTHRILITSLCRPKVL